MKKINSLLAIVLLSASVQLCAIQEQDLQRYNELVANFDKESKIFLQDFELNKDEDIRIIIDHKKYTQDTVKQYENSWIPKVLRILSYGFVINAVINSINATLKGINASDLIMESFFKIASPITRYPLKPIRYSVDKLTTPIIDSLFDLRYGKYWPDSAWNRYRISLNTSRSIFSLALAAYLNNKANNYATKINELENKMEADNNMLQALDSEDYLLSESE